MYTRISFDPKEQRFGVERQKQDCQKIAERHGWTVVEYYEDNDRGASKYSKKKRQNKLPYGTCRVTVSRTRIVQSIYGSIQEYAGFERPAWLE